MHEKFHAPSLFRHSEIRNHTKNKQKNKNTKNTANKSTK